MANFEASRKYFNKKNVKMAASEYVVQRLLEAKVLKLEIPDFYEQICSHFERMPARYAMLAKNDVDLNILGHIKLLEAAKNPNTALAFDIHKSKVHPADESTREKIFGITCAAIEKPGLLHTVTIGIDSMGLEIKEASMLSTTDAFCLLVFVVASRDDKTPAQLTRDLKRQISTLNQHGAVVQVRIDVEDQLPTNQSRRSCLMVWVKCLLCLGSIATTVMLCVVGLLLMNGKLASDGVVEFAKCIGRMLLVKDSSKTKDINKDSGAALVFVAVPLVGLASILTMFMYAIYREMQAGEKFLILWWLLVDLGLGAYLQFAGIADRLMAKSMNLFAMLGTVVAAVTGFYRKMRGD